MVEFLSSNVSVFSCLSFLVVWFKRRNFLPHFESSAYCLREMLNSSAHKCPERKSWKRKEKKAQILNKDRGFFSFLSKI